METRESCLIIAGEKSGEDHAMTFFPELQKRHPNCLFYGVGGEKLQALNVDIMYNLKDFSGIGISEVLSKIPFYLKAMKNILAEVDRKKTKTAILIDFQGFNLKLARKLKKRGVNVLYYVAPQAWVWKPWRAKVLEQNVHTLFTILPFEKKWFRQRGVSKIKGVIHPLVTHYGDKLKNIRERKFTDFSSRPVRILLLPGSRNVEVSRLLPIFIEGIKLVKETCEDIELGIVKTETVNSELYSTELEIKKSWTDVDMTEALEWADMCVASSGTVTLATGLFGVPTVVCYQVSLVTEFIFNLFLPYTGPASLTNIVHEEYVYPEFIQYRADRYNVAKSIKTWISNPDEYDKTVEKLTTTLGKLSGDDFSPAEYMSEVLEGRI